MSGKSCFGRICSRHFLPPRRVAGQYNYNYIFKTGFQLQINRKLVTFVHALQYSPIEFEVMGGGATFHVIVNGILKQKLYKTMQVIL